MQISAPSTRFHERQPVVPADSVFDSESPIKIAEVGAAAEQDVLTVIDDFAGTGMFIRRSSTAKEWLAFEEGNRIPGVCERTCGGQSGEATTDYGDARGRCSCLCGSPRHVSRRQKPSARMRSFSRVVRRTRLE